MASRRIDMDIADTLMERPTGFSVGGRHFCLYPASLGKAFLISRLFEALEIGRAGELSILALKPVITEKRGESLRLLAYSTLQGKECLDEDKVEGRINELESLPDEDLATLIVLVAKQDKTADIKKTPEIERERRRLEKITKVKKGDSSAVSVGGKTIWGTLIDFACERYGWTVDYCVWGVSYSNLEMLMTDHIKTFYLTDKEKKKIGAAVDNNVIRADNVEKLREVIRTTDWK